jgi:hypothetical protein
MVQGIQAYSYPQNVTGTPARLQETSVQASFQFQARIDYVSFSSNAVSGNESQEIVLNRAFEKLRAVVAEAREALGIPEGTEVDTSPEATANRIADFALNFFAQYAENNGLADDEEGRAQFAAFIGDAINQGIDEARGILDALSALTPETESSIDQIAEYIQSRLDDFIANGLGN